MKMQVVKVTHEDKPIVVVSGTVHLDLAATGKTTEEATAKMIAAVKQLRYDVDTLIQTRYDEVTVTLENVT